MMTRIEAAPVTLPSRYAQCVDREIATRIVGRGETALLAEPLLGLVASRECPGNVLLETLELVPQWVRAGHVVVSGFHSPLEQQVLKSLLRRQGRAVKVLACGIAGYRPTPEESEALAAGRMLVISACLPIVTRTTRATALARNRLVMALAAETVVPFVSDGSPLGALMREAT
jgi:predicted Rossmann fold nucleotide-binding protein DprA/Smf involved in DNA uptake